MIAAQQSTRDIKGNKEMATKCATPDEKKLTWLEVKNLIEQAGVKNNDEIDRIDISWGRIDEFICNKDEDFGWMIQL